MKRQLAILFPLLLAAIAAHAGDTNLPAPSTMTVMVDTNGLIVAPTNLAAANDFASATDAAAVASAFTSHTSDAAQVWAVVDSLSNQVQYISARGESYQFSEAWDFADSENTADWFSTNSAAWVTNAGLRLGGGDLTCTTNAPRLLWLGSQTDVLYRVTWTVFLEGDLAPLSVLFEPTGEEFVLYGTNLQTFTSTFTNSGTQIAFRRCSLYYNSAYLTSITVESGNDIPDPATLIGSPFLPTQTNLPIGSAEAPFGTVYASGIGLTDVLEPRPTIVTNADVTLYAPRWIGEALVDVGSNKTYRAYGTTTNDWGD